MTPSQWIFANMVRDGLRRAHKVVGLVERNFPRWEIDVCIAAEDCQYIDECSYDINRINDIDVVFTCSHKQRAVEIVKVTIDSTVTFMARCVDATVRAAEREMPAVKPMPQPPAEVPAR